MYSLTVGLVLKLSRLIQKGTECEMHHLIFNILFISMFTVLVLSVNIPVREIGLSSFEHLFHDGKDLNQIYAI